MAESPFTPSMEAQLQALLNMSGQRVAETQPIHQAAMAMATRMAPGYARAAMGPVPSVPGIGTNSSANGSASSVFNANAAKTKGPNTTLPIMAAILAGLSKP